MSLSKKMNEMADIEEEYAIKLDKDFRGWGNPAVDAISYDVIGWRLSLNGQ